MPALNSRMLAKLQGRSPSAQPVQDADSLNSSARIPSVTRELEVHAPPSRVWDALTDPATITRWLTCQDVTFDARPGGRYTLFDGDATGAITRADPPRLLEYTWQMGEWPAGAPPSRVRWDLVPVARGKRTRLRLTHTGFPDQATRDAHDAGWEPNFLDKLLAWLD